MNNFAAMPGPFEYIAHVEPRELTTIEVGYQPLLEREIVIKRLAPNAAVNPRMRNRFIREARLLASLHHHNIIQVYESELQDDIPYVILEHLDGITLQQRLEQMIDQQDRMDPDEVFQIVGTMVDTVEHIHQHAALVNDLSPANIVLTVDGRIVLAGLGQPLPENIWMATPTTLAYAAPERLLGGAVDCRSDVYALGVLLFHLLCGRLPFEGSSLGVITKKQSDVSLLALDPLRNELPYVDVLGQMLQRALARQASRRYPNVAAFREALNQALVVQPTTFQAYPQVPVAGQSRVQLRQTQQVVPRTKVKQPTPVMVPPAAQPTPSKDHVAVNNGHPPAAQVPSASAPFADGQIFTPLPQVTPLPNTDTSRPPTVQRHRQLRRWQQAAMRSKVESATAVTASSVNVAPTAVNVISNNGQAQPLPAAAIAAPVAAAVAAPVVAPVAPVVEQVRKPLPPVVPLPDKDSARQVLTSEQKVVAMMLIGFIITGFIFNWLLTLQVLISIVTIFYLASTAFKLKLIQTSLHTRLELPVSPKDIDATYQGQLPIYTILVPLYKESEVLPNLVRSMATLDYPFDRLDIKLLLEEDDQDTIEAARAINLPSYFEIVIVPQGRPKGKPRACNYGLQTARGDYLVIYDAEDEVDPLQLKHALAAFEVLGPQTVCVQAKLNYYNQSQNLLTRLFTAEYSMWFDLFLPGLQALGVPIPLGGTSNHFRVDVLRSLGGWDAWNVTEDADLGLRLYKRGYATGVIESTTYEEANSQVRNWIRQRSRWFKGYIQTWLVHMRNPAQLLQELGPRGFLGFQMMVFGTFFTVLVNPIFWVLMLLWILTQWHIIELTFVGPAFYLGGLCLYIGNFALMYMSMAGCLNRGYSKLVRYTLLAPLYWVIMSFACWKGFLQLFTNPFYWEKTIHGLYKGAPHAPHAPHAEVKA